MKFAGIDYDVGHTYSGVFTFTFVGYRDLWTSVLVGGLLSREVFPID